MAPSIETLAAGRPVEPRSRFIFNLKGANKFNGDKGILDNPFQPGDNLVVCGPQPSQDHTYRLERVDDGRSVLVNSKEDLFTRMERPRI
jgi:hypothetical protein